MNRYDITGALGLVTFSAGVYLTIGIGPSLIAFGVVLLVASFFAGRSGAIE